MEVTRESLAAAIAQARVGNHVGDIGHAVQQVAEGAGYGVVRELVGHGIGTRFHEEPQVPNYGSPRRGPRLLEGMTLAIEPMITMGNPGHPDPGRQVDRGDGRRQPLRPLRAHRGDHRQRTADPHRGLSVTPAAAPAAASPAVPPPPRPQPSGRRLHHPA